MNLQLERYSFLKKSNYYKVLRDIVIPFCFKFVSKIFRSKVDENLIIMGAYSGNSYMDNTKYLFEFLNKRSNYNVVWFTKSRGLLVELRNKGYNVVYALSLNAIKLLRKARFIFLTHGVYDVLPIDFSPKTEIIMTWHGTVIKDITEDFDATYSYKKWVRILKLKSYPNQYIDYVLTPAKGRYEHKILAKAFRVDSAKILDLGYPRNDILFDYNLDFKKKLREKYGIPDNIKRVILYAPTFRDAGSLRFPFKNKDLEDLNTILEESMSIFLFKGHVYEKKINFGELKYISLVRNPSDIQELIIISDLLISDYSSVTFDFLLTMKPVILFPYDLDVYEKGRGLHYDLREIAPGPIVYDVETFIESIKNIEEIDVEYKDIREKIRDRFNKYHDGKSSERLLTFLNISFDRS
jgi:CDP-glycerol glycerophosphotransferase